VDVKTLSFHYLFILQIKLRNEICIESAVLNSFWSPHPVRKNEFCTPCTIWCIFVVGVQAPPIENRWYRWKSPQYAWTSSFNCSDWRCKSLFGS